MIGPRKASIGESQKRGMFQRPGPPVPDGTGYTQSWIDLAPSAFARISPATQASLEQVAAGTVLSTATHIVVTPYRTGLTTKTRFLVDGRQLNVLSVSDPDERHAELVLLCAEVVE